MAPEVEHAVIKENHTFDNPLAPPCS